MSFSGLEIKSIIMCRDRENNENSVDDIKSPVAWIPIPASLVAITRLSRVGYRNAVSALSRKHELSPSSA